MWQAIQYVSSGFTLAAFVVAVIAWVSKSKSEERAKLIDLAKEDERAKLVQDALEFFHVETAGLTKAQQYQLAREQIRARAQRFKIVAVVVCIIALLGTVVAAYAITRQSPAPTKGEPDSARQVKALLGEARTQFTARAYSGAWETVEQATALMPTSEEARDLQVDVAMAWLREWQSAPQAVFDLVENKLAPCLENAAPKAKGIRAADIHAHIGWANFLRRIDNLPVEAEFKRAVAEDGANPFAHAMYGYWLIAQSHRPKEGKAHFESAFKSGLQTNFVRQIQLDAWRRNHDPDQRLELVLVLDDMRKKNESWTIESRRRLFSDAYANPEPEFLRKFKTILPAADHLATFQWLTDGFGAEENITRDFFLAQLTEASGDNAKALKLYRALLAQPTSFDAEIKEGIKRTKGHAGQGSSETSALIEQAKSGDAATRAKLIRSLARANVDVAEALPAVVSWVRDADGEVRAAACDTLVQFGRVAVPKVVPLLSSGERRDVMNAAGILGQIHLEPELAVPALGKALAHPDADVRGKVVDALANFGAEAEPAVAPLLQMLMNTVQTDLQKQVAYAFGEIGPGAKAAVPQLIEFVKSSKDPDGFLNVNAARALGKIGPAAATAVPALIDALKSDDVRLPTVAAEALGRIGAGAKAAIPALIEAMKVTEKEHRDNYAEPLGMIAEALANKGDTQSLPALKKAMQSLELANVEPKFITPVRAAVDVLEEKESRSKKN